MLGGGVQRVLLDCVLATLRLQVCMPLLVGTGLRGEMVTPIPTSLQAVCSHGGATAHLLWGIWGVAKAAHEFGS